MSQRVWVRGWIWAGVLGLFALLAARATQALGPETPFAPLYNSDCAVPVLMCQPGHWTLFDLYYYGQDRFGSWPFLLTRAAGQLLGFRPTHLHLHAWLTVWLLSGVFVLAALARGLRLLAAGLYLLVVLAQPEVRLTLFDLAQVYPWQLTALLLAWWSLRRDNEWVAASVGRPASRWSAVLFRVRTFLLCFLAIWTNTVSGPLLALLSGAEAVRARLVAPEAFPGLRALRRWGEGVLLAGVAFVLEALLRGAYHRYARLHYGRRYGTTLDIDWPYLRQNAHAIAEAVWSSSTLPWLLVGTGGALVSAVLLWRALRAGGRRQDALLECAVLLLSSWGMAVAHLVLLTVLNHVRNNGYNTRYFLPVYLFGSLSGGLTLALAVGWLSSRFQGLARAPQLLGAGAVAFAAWSLPTPEVNPEFVELRATALRLARLKPGAPLLGGYWATYVLSSLQSEGALVPVPHQDDYQRTMWLARAVKEHAEVLVEHSDFPAGGSAEAPEPWIFQYDTLLHLEQPRWEHGAGRTFSVYRNMLDASQPHTTEPALAQWELCSPGTSLTLRFTPRERALVMVALWKPHPLVTLTAEPLWEGAGASATPVTLRSNDRLHLATLDGGGTLLRGVRITASPARAGSPPDPLCGAAATFVLEPPLDPSKDAAR